MKATGIVRRIDDLGRVVIPKEIRRTMRIREGDPLEIYTDRNGEVIFKKYPSYFILYNMIIMILCTGKPVLIFLQFYSSRNCRLYYICPCLYGRQSREDG